MEEKSLEGRGYGFPCRFKPRSKFYGICEAVGLIGCYHLGLPSTPIGQMNRYPAELDHLPSLTLPQSHALSFHTEDTISYSLKVVR